MRRCGARRVIGVVNGILLSVLLSGCSCAIFTVDLIPEKGMDRVSNRVFFDVAKENGFRGHVKSCRGLEKGSMMFRQEEDRFVLQDSVCPSPLNFWSLSSRQDRVKGRLDDQSLRLEESFSKRGVGVRRSR